MKLVVEPSLARQIGEQVMKKDPENLREGVLFGKRDTNEGQLIVEGVRVPQQRPGTEGSEINRQDTDRIYAEIREIVVGYVYYVVDLAPEETNYPYARELRLDLEGRNHPVGSLVINRQGEYRTYPEGDS